MLGQEQMSKEDFLRAEQSFYRELREKRNEVRKFKASLREHEQALELLSDLPKKTRHDIMVPIGPLAFMPGHLIHTNEITVLLGESYFAERSAEQASGIISRRKDFIQKLIKKSEEEEKKLSARAHTSDYMRKSLLEGLAEDQSEHAAESNQPPHDEDDDDDDYDDYDEDDDDGKGYDFWSRAGFVGAWSDAPDDSARTGPPGAAVGTDPAEPVFEILEPVGGGPGRVVRHSNQIGFEGLGGLRAAPPGTGPP